MGSLIALTIGMVGAAAFWLISAPLPWMLGSMTATAVAAIAGAPWVLPRKARDVARPVIGVLAGSAFSPAILEQWTSWGGAIAAVILFGIVTTLTGTWLFRRVAGYDKATAFFAATPAGLAEMSLMGESLGGNIRTLSLIHTMRIVAVILFVPIIAGTDGSRSISNVPVHASPTMQDAALLLAIAFFGYWFGRRLKFPNSIMIVTMVLSAAVHITDLTRAAPPIWLVIIVQVVIGCVVGARFTGVTAAELRSTFFFGALWAATLLGLSVGAATLLAALLGFDRTPMLLALAPGGMVEMTLVTYALGIEVAMVATCQVLRNASTMLIAPAMWRLMR